MANVHPSCRGVVPLPALALLLFPHLAGAAELRVLTPENWDRLAPRGKEVDAIYGDLVLRNERLIAVIAAPVPGRHAHTTAREVGGALLDLTMADRQSDQLTAFFPGGQGLELRFARAVRDGEQLTPDDHRGLELEGRSVSIVLLGRSHPELEVEVRYSLADGQDFVEVETRHRNAGRGMVEAELVDGFRIDQSRDGLAVERAPDGVAADYWAYDPWFGQAYAVTAPGYRMRITNPTASYTPTFLYYERLGEEGPRSSRIQLFPTVSVELVRRLYPAHDLLEARALLDGASAGDWVSTSVAVHERAGQPVAGASVSLYLEPAGEGGRHGFGRTGADGSLSFLRPRKAGRLLVEALGQGERSVELAPDAAHVAVELDPPGVVAARIRDPEGRPTPCKVQFYGRHGTPDPFFGPDHGEPAVHNVYYSHDGTFRQVLPPGSYEVIISRGNEYDALFQTIEVEQGAEVALAATLRRTVDTSGWISADFHSHSTPSGDNVSSQRGRVLNHLAEQIEFAPCTEHNWVSSYLPHLEALGAAAELATCSGIELTGMPIQINHQNAFPLAHRPLTQNGGGPDSDLDPEVQIERLALWDERSDKLVQQNHPSIPQLFFDRDRDGERDGGFAKMVTTMDVMEVHDFGPYPTLEAILWAPFTDRPRPDSFLESNVQFGWFQLLNLGYQIPGVANSDGHANFHGTGFLRNYVRSATDRPAEIDPLEIVAETRAGHLIMTNGPFLEVELEAAEGGARGIPGDHVQAPGGRATLRVKVQCPNWLDVDRIQVYLNGRAAEELNLRRSTDADAFADGVVKFERALDLELERDAHVIVAAIGEHSRIGPVMGPEHRDEHPIALSNPIFVDVDGEGFTPNGDTFGVPVTVVEAP